MKNRYYNARETFATGVDYLEEDEKLDKVEEKNAMYKLGLKFVENFLKYIANNHEDKFIFNYFFLLNKELPTDVTKNSKVVENLISPQLT
eukprot:UN18455